MKTIRNFDVAVVGSGPAGIGAALAAARCGVRTLLIEKNSVLGGQMTSGLVTGFHGFRAHDGFTQKGDGSVLMTDRRTPMMVKGLPLEIMNRLAEKGAAYMEADDPPMRVEYDPEALIPLLFQMCKESGVELLLDTFVFGVEMDRNRIQRVRAANKSGEVCVEAKVFVDASADGDLLAWSGCEYSMGDAQTGRCMPLSVYQVLGGVDLQKTLDYLRENPDDLHISTVGRWQEMYDKGAPVSLTGFRRLVRKAAEAGDYPCALNLETKLPNPIFDIQTSWMRRGMVKLLVDMAYGIDITDGDELTKAEADMRMNQAPGIFQFMRKYVPGFESCYLLYTAPLIGTRESRRLNGLYRINKEDVLNNRRFQDSVARCGRAMNVHSSGGGGQTSERGGQQWIEAESPEGFDVPYRALMPVTVENLLASGRCISVDRDALGSVRGEPVCMATGEAAGVAAALAAQGGRAVQDVPVAELQKLLLKRNVIL